MISNKIVNGAGVSQLGLQLTRNGRFFSVEVIRFLLECGANAHAICLGRYMLLLAMFSGGKESCPCVLEQKLCLLIRAGIDVNFADRFGRTPSDNARQEGCWDEWCRALESSNLNIDEVLALDESRKKHLRGPGNGCDTEDDEETDAVDDETENDGDNDSEDDETENDGENDSEDDVTENDGGD